MSLTKNDIIKNINYKELKNIYIISGFPKLKECKIVGLECHVIIRQPLN